MNRSLDDVALVAAPTQKYLRNKGLIVLLAMLSAFVPLSTDIYLPALPSMTSYFHVHQSLVNLTLILFFVFYGVGTLFWGPMSDKYGRKPILLIGMAIYVAASVLCAASSSIYLLILSRALQAIGGSVATAISTAIVKDVYSGRKRESVLAVVQSMVVISPAVAPVIGALLLRTTSWQGLFLAQAMIGMAALVGVLAFQETLRQRSSRTTLQSIGRLVVVLKEPRFTSLLITFSLISIASMAFISASSYIYQNSFGLSGEVYSYYFAFNAIGMLLGPLIYLRLSARFPRNAIVTGGFLLMVLSGLLVCLLGTQAPWLFAITLWPATIATSGLRPPGTFLMLEQQAEDAGSASSLISSLGIAMGSLGIVLVSFDWSSQLVVVGLLNIIFGLASGCGWFFISHRSFLRHESPQ